MTNVLKISLKPNEKIYINGAVIRVDRKVTVELMNDVQFLLESHVIQAEDASTPLKQLYFILQIMLMNPPGAVEARDMFRRSLPDGPPRRCLDRLGRRRTPRGARTRLLARLRIENA